MYGIERLVTVSIDLPVGDTPRKMLDAIKARVDECYDKRIPDQAYALRQLAHIVEIGCCAMDDILKQPVSLIVPKEKIGGGE
jgi:hypothetical protein